MASKGGSREELYERRKLISTQGLQIRLRLGHGLKGLNRRVSGGYLVHTHEFQRSGPKAVFSPQTHTRAGVGVEIFFLNEQKTSSRKKLMHIILPEVSLAVCKVSSCQERIIFEAGRKRK